jgi:hypothetical protein
MRQAKQNKKGGTAMETTKNEDLYCECEGKEYDPWEDPEAVRVFDDEMGFCVICPRCGLWNK